MVSCFLIYCRRHWQHINPKMKLTFLTFLSVVFTVKIIKGTDRELLQEFMATSLVQNPVRFDKPMCPREVNISWKLRPPYTLKRNESGNQSSVVGIFQQTLDFALEKCCKFYGDRKPRLRYLAASSNSSELLRNIFNEEVKKSVVFPIHKDQLVGYTGPFEYINIIDSPGVVLIQRNPGTTERCDHLSKAILAAWPIVVLSLLLSCLAGICIWMLVGLNSKKRNNPKYADN